MSSLRKTLTPVAILALTLSVTAVSAVAQYRNSAASEIVRRIQAQTNTLRTSVQNAAARNNYPTDDSNRLINDFSTATNRLNRRLTNGRATSSDAQSVLDRGVQIDTFFVNSRFSRGPQREWQTLRGQLDELAQAYNLSSNWSTGGSTGNASPNDQQLWQLIQRIDTKTTAFGRNLRQDLNTRRLDNVYPVNQVRQQLSSFESAEIQLRNRINSRQVNSNDVQTFLQTAVLLNNYLNDRQLSYQTENSWTVLRQDLDQLASSFNVAWNWTTPSPGNGGGYGNYGSLTGTFKIATGQSDDARRAADAATRTIPSTDRQRVYDSLLRRLDPPEMLAIDRRGNSVTIVSTRAPQINFVADGREQVETTARGRTIRVRASLLNDQLSITRSGDRADDFTVTFEPIERGRRLQVSRTLYSDRLTQPITVRSYYDRVSDVAQLNIYDSNREGNVGQGPVGTFGVPDGTQIVAVLNNDLSTETVRENDRFTMTVKSPGQFDGATIEGYVTSVSRGGRISGRSEMSLNFDTIRFRDGQSYRFAGILESVRMPNGEVVQIDNEGAVRESDQTNKTVTRTAIGTAVGAIIGAIAGGGKGAAIGAVIGAGAGAGSVYVQGRNDLDLTAGTEVTVRATGPRS
ncbi:MAG TPA: YMGG-like glycine zipper-containing protein [Pyrinomonadaceae bacterium]|nr:YMGG-like glycine zipper-containing protein [Pyrinomonadaceae bacterium]